MPGVSHSFLMTGTQRNDQTMRKTVPAKKQAEQKPYFFDPTKKEREARINATVKKALKGITPRV
jgi:hypothetical protein